MSPDAALLGPTRTVIAEVIKPNYTITLMGVTDYTTDIQNGDPGLYNKTTFARITNTSNENVNLTHKSGSVAGWAFRADSIVDATNPEVIAELPSHPIDSTQMSTTSATILPGNYFDIKGDPHHITHAIGFIRRQASPVKTVLITYAVSFTLENKGELTEVYEKISVPMNINLLNDTR
jgi:hypothetical protein